MCGPALSGHVANIMKRQGLQKSQLMVLSVLLDCSICPVPSRLIEQSHASALMVLLLDACCREQTTRMQTGTCIVCTPQLEGNGLA